MGPAFHHPPPPVVGSLVQNADAWRTPAYSSTALLPEDVHVTPTTPLLPAIKAPPPTLPSIPAPALPTFQRFTRVNVAERAAAPIEPDPLMEDASAPRWLDWTLLLTVVFSSTLGAATWLALSELGLI